MNEAFEVITRVIEVSATSVSAIGIFIAGRQLGLSKEQAQTSFEDSLSREYRELAQRLPTAALLGESLNPDAQRESLDEFFRYFDLSNEQVFIRMQGRVSRSAWRNWCDGIQGNLARPAFRSAWEDVSGRNPEIFSELRRLLASGCKEDPHDWR